MKFTKTAVALVIAGIAAAPMIASADTTLSGTVALKLAGDDSDDGDVAVAADDVLMGVVSEHELNSGLTGYGSLRYDLNALSGAGTAESDNVYVGIKGGFGDVRIGEVPVAAEYGQVANDLHDVTGDMNDGLSYTGSFGGFGIGLNFSPEPNSDAVGLGAKFALGGFSIGVGGEDRAGQTNISAGASFALAGASVAVHYWVQQPDGDGDDDPSAIAVKVGYGFGDVAAALTFSQGENVDDFETKIRLDLSYGLGGGMTLSSRINANSDSLKAEPEEDIVDYRIMLAKAF